MPLDVHPNQFAYTVYDRNGQKICENIHAADGAQATPSVEIGSTFEVFDDGVHMLGTVSDVRTFAPFDPNNMRYGVWIICQNSHPV
mgnify:CR=1 FL=1